MRLTPLDIRKQEFTRGFRGYEADEVQAFLHMVSNQWDDLLDEQRRLGEKLREMESKLVHYEKVEEALQEALQTARESSRKTLENAEKKAQLIVEEAEARAAEIKREAEQDRHALKRDAAKINGRRNEIVARLRAFLMSEMELLARFEGDDPIGFIKLLPAEEERLRRVADRSLPPASEREDLGEEVDEVEARSEEPSAPEREEAPEEAPRDAGAAEPPAERSGAADEGNADEDRGRQEIRQGTGWTARTVVSTPSEQRPRRSEEESDDRPRKGWSDEGNVTASDEEIEKIRRILSDLD